MKNFGLILISMALIQAQNNAGIVGPFLPTDFCIESGFLDADGTQKQINTCSNTPMGS